MSETANARQAALSVVDQYQLTPTSLVAYQSNGRVAVIGDSASLAHCLPWSDDLDMQMVTTECEVEVDGYLGAFTVTQTDEHGNIKTLVADILLDLCAVPISKMEMLPPGYIHTLISDENAEDVRTQLSELVGEFDKPKYFNYDPSICAHSVNGQVVCSNCIDACPAGAIESLAEAIEVNPYLCQGGGACATACPSGAIEYAYPGLADNGSRVRKMLEAFRQNGGERAMLVFHAEEAFPQSIFTVADNILPFGVEELASVGADLCLSAVAFGAARVVLLAGDDIPRVSHAQLERQLRWLGALLEGLGFDKDLVRLQSIEEWKFEDPDESPIQPAIYTMPGRKRQSIYQALDHLYQQTGKTRELVDLPAGAPFGTALIDESRCTLCMACVGACPGNALQDGSNREMPEVFFIEANCLQCGACTQTCPEDAIQISPRLIFDREHRNTARALNRDQPFACIGCGKPFAPTSVIHKMQDRLKDHYMFNSDRALDRLKMCENCRVADIVQDPEAMKGNFDPLS